MLHGLLSIDIWAFNWWCENAPLPERQTDKWVEWWIKWGVSRENCRTMWKMHMRK